ncbi:MAG: BrnT family toxin [Pseudomonadota bacterium]
MSKDRLNQRKHSVSFEEEKSLFYDDLAVQFFDDSHSLQEDRFLMLGMSSQSKLLLVCHCVRESDIIRIISARKATKQESKLYPGGA